MYLIDTNVISEARKREKANPGVTAFFREAESSGAALFLSVITVGELRRGVDLIRHRGDVTQAAGRRRAVAEPVRRQLKSAAGRASRSGHG